jgi:hypothetical protein
MRGILSTNPAPSTARLLVGSHLLLLVQAGLVLSSQAPRDTILLVLIAGVTAIAAMALVAAIVGEQSVSPTTPRGGRHD